MDKICEKTLYKRGHSNMINTSRNRDLTPSVNRESQIETTV